MEITQNKVSYFFRIIRGLAVFIILAIILFVFFSVEYGTNSYIMLLIPGFIIAFSFLRLEHWYRYYITNISIVGDDINIKYYDRTKFKSIEVKSENIEVKLDRAFTMSLTYKLVIMINDRREIVQYQNMNWTREDILKLYNHLKQ